MLHLPLPQHHALPLPPSAEIIRDRRRLPARALVFALSLCLAIILLVSLIDGGPQPLETRANIDALTGLPKPPLSRRAGQHHPAATPRR